MTFLRHRALTPRENEIIDALCAEFDKIDNNSPDELEQIANAFLKAKKQCSK